MDKMIAFCGLICTECPAFLATQKDENKERRKVAQMWSEQFKKEIKPEDVNCDGCLSDNGRLWNYCKVCEIRKCSQERGVKNCAYCDDYTCQKLSNFFEEVPEAKTILEEIRKNL